jgi:hypothetical protein
MVNHSSWSSWRSSRAPTGLPPPGGELTSQADGYDCHPMARGAITHGLSVSPTYPIFNILKGPPGAIILLLKRDLLACMLQASGSPIHVVVLR